MAGNFYAKFTLFTLRQISTTNMIISSVFVLLKNGNAKKSIKIKQIPGGRADVPAPSVRQGGGEHYPNALPCQVTAGTF